MEKDEISCGETSVVASQKVQDFCSTIAPSLLGWDIPRVGYLIVCWGAWLFSSL